MSIYPDLINELEWQQCDWPQLQQLLQARTQSMNQQIEQLRRQVHKLENLAVQHSGGRVTSLRSLG
jgi:polyhydroxyalkanoate synthesis regulator phasin